MGDEGVDRPEGPLIASGRGRGHLEPAERTPEATVHVAHGHIQCVTERLDLCGGNIAEARPDDDRLGEAPHLGHGVDRLVPLGPWPPALEHLARGPRDDGSELRVLAGLESGLHLSTPLAPTVAVNHGQAIAEESAHACGGRTLRIPAGIVLEDVLDVIWMAQQIDLVPAEPHGDHVAVALRAFHEEAEGIASRPRKHAHERIARGPRGGASRRSDGHPSAQAT